MATREAVVNQPCQQAVHCHIGVCCHQDACRGGALAVAICQLQGEELQHGHQKGALARAEGAVYDADGGVEILLLCGLWCIGMGYMSVYPGLEVLKRQVFWGESNVGRLFSRVKGILE